MPEPAVPQSDPSLYVPQTQDPALTAIIQALIQGKNAVVSGAQSLINQATTPHPFYIPTTPDPTVFGGDPPGAGTIASGGVTAPPPLQRPPLSAQQPAAPGQPAEPAHPPVIGHPQTQPAAANTNAPGLSPGIMAMVKALPPDMQVAFLTKYANDRALEQALVDKQNQQSQLVDKMLQEKPPTYEGSDAALRAPPPTPDIQPIKAFQNWGVALAMLGSLLTRRPLTAALKSGAAAMKAYNEARWQDYGAARQQWKDSVDLAMKQNDIEFQKYEAARELYHDDLNKLTLAYKQIADEYGNKVALHDIENGTMDDYLNMRAQINDEIYRYKALNMHYSLQYGGMNAAQRMHDDVITRARDELTRNHVNWQDDNWLASLKIGPLGLTPEQKHLVSLYGKARQGLYSELYGLPGVDRTHDLGAPIKIPPDKTNILSAPDGTRISLGGQVWVKQGDSLVPTGEAVPADGTAAPADTTAPDTSPPPVPTGGISGGYDTGLGY